jgi:hypothetical protein
MFLSLYRVLPRCRGIRDVVSRSYIRNSDSIGSSGSAIAFRNHPLHDVKYHRQYCSSAINLARIARGSTRVPRERVVNNEALKRSEEAEQLEETLKRSQTNSSAESDPFYLSSSGHINSDRSVDHINNGQGSHLSSDPAVMAAAGTNLSKSWSWVPPRHAAGGAAADSDVTHIPVIPKSVYLLFPLYASRPKSYSISHF